MSFFHPFLHFPFFIFPFQPPNLPLSLHTPKYASAPFSFSAFCSLIVVASDVRDLNGGERPGGERKRKFFRFAGQKFARTRRDWLALRAFVAFNNENHPPPLPFSILVSLSPFLLFSLFITFLYAPLTRSIRNAALFEISVLPLPSPPAKWWYIYRERGSWTRRGICDRRPILGSVLTTTSRCWEKNCCAIMAQFLAGIRNYSTSWGTVKERGEGRGNDPRELTRNWTRNAPSFRRRPTISSIVSSMILWRERESGKSARIIISSQREREREGGRFKRDGEIRCASIMPVSRELSRDRLLTCWNTRVAIGDYMIGVIWAFIIESNIEYV